MSPGVGANLPLRLPDFRFGATGAADNCDGSDYGMKNGLRLLQAIGNQSSRQLSRMDYRRVQM
jgi:hypothetical protein